MERDGVVNRRTAWAFALPAILCLTSALGVATAASAAVESQADAGRDVTMFVYEADWSDVSAEHPKGKARADIVRFRTSHRTDRISMRLGLREVRRNKDAQTSAAFWLRKDGGRLWRIDLTHWKGTTVTLTRWYANRAPREVDCEGLRGATVRKVDQYRVSLPPACVQDPVWIRTGATVSFAHLSNPLRGWGDDARADAALTPQDNKLVLGPRVRAT